MIHHSLCDGLGMPSCYGCKRFVEHYPDHVLAVNRSRLQPAADPPRCADWMALPRSQASLAERRP